MKYTKNILHLVKMYTFSIHYQFLNRYATKLSQHVLIHFNYAKGSTQINSVTFMISELC